MRLGRGDELFDPGKRESVTDELGRSLMVRVTKATGPRITPGHYSVGPDVGDHVGDVDRHLPGRTKPGVGELEEPRLDSEDLSGPLPMRHAPASDLFLWKIAEGLCHLPSRKPAEHHAMARGLLREHRTSREQLVVRMREEDE